MDRPSPDVRCAALRDAAAAPDPPAPRRAGGGPPRGRSLSSSPEHRVLITGAAARELWGEPEVLVRAADLVGDRYITVDHSLRETWYIHLMLERHEVIWAKRAGGRDLSPRLHGAGPSERWAQRDTLFDLRPDLFAQSRPLRASRAPDGQPCRSRCPVGWRALRLRVFARH